MPNLSLETFQGSDAEWDEALSRMDGRTFCHQAGWSEVFSRALGHETIRLLARDADGAIVGLLPMVRMRSTLFGHNLVSMPFLNYGGPLGTAEAKGGLTELAAETARDSGAKLLELRTRSEDDLGLAVSTDKVTVLLPLPEEAEELWSKGIKAKVRSQIRRPMKAGMEAKIGTERIGHFYDVFTRNMRDLGTPVLPFGLFEAIVEAFSEQVVVSVVYADELPVAAGVGFLYDGEFELTWASSLRSHAREAPNMLLYWSLMEHVIERGAKTFNFGRCTPGGGTHRFKLQWGGVDEQLYWSRWTRSAGGGSPSQESPTMQRAIKVWQRLPLPVANAIGPMISRGLPSF